MPELPEVETIKLGLSKLLPGLVITNVQHDWPKSFPNAPADVERFMVGAKVLGVRRRAKVLIIDLNTKYSLLVHLKMTGQLVFVGQERFGAGHPSADLIASLPAKATRVIIDFAGASKLFFNDQRKFGWMRLMPTIEIPEIDFFKKVGPEPLEAGFKPADFIDRLQRRKNSSIKAALLDQTVIAGVGNIYADESLWAAKIHPAGPVSTVSNAKLIKLYQSLREILNLSIKKGGSTDRNYVDSQGKKGSYLSFAKVFRRQGQPCPRCGTPIEKIRVAGRGTHFCPHCQKLPRSPK
ncbi:MAG TPA: bifunctional DNA-formamidopyrimidine glycosylase/DNA-(apurinic or apyrimidinic site) lyase [Candidatus Saccharimonadales bacterium]|nr:bifunctional DNA-formamidopyrimidine glycosylase/DNA-(apurinic or apyrimidinic site) lyase [Candidatus Saccharimonadales bacterium]